MQVSKIEDAVTTAKKFIRSAEEVLAQADKARFLLCDGKQAKALKTISNKLVQTLTEMRRP